MNPSSWAHVGLVIPALNPDIHLILLLRQLREVGFNHIVVVDDGSSSEHQAVFDAARPLITRLIRHPNNLGKGAALKSAFAALLEDPHIGHAITLDADGQHLPEDVLALARLAAEPQVEVALGVRRFDGDVPLRSRFGNRLTQWVFWRLSGLRVSDTQTGLRLLSRPVLQQIVNLEGDRYEYEMNMLAFFARSRIAVREVGIQTVYIDANRGSHFRPVIDSLKIYYVLFREAVVSLSSFGLDVALFSLVLALSGSLLWATALARLVSASYNFLGHKFFVFHGRQRLGLLPQLIEYSALVLLFMFLSYRGVDYWVSEHSIEPVLAKIGVDAALFVASFLIRRHVIFRHAR